MIKYLLPLLFIVSLAGAQTPRAEPAKSAEAPKKSSGQLDDIMVTGEDKLKVKSDKPVLDIKLDLNQVVMPTIDTEKKFLDKSPNLVDLKEAAPKMLNSAQLAAPFLVAFIREPIANFSLKVLGIKTATWDLVVTDSKGRVFKKFEGKGKPPLSLEWNGRNPENRIVKVGNAYSYLVTLVDEAGGPHTLIGAPFVLHSLIHQEENGLFLSLTRKKVFDVEKDKNKILYEALPFLKEASDSIKDNFTLPVVVNVYGENASLATEQAKAVAKYFTDELVLPQTQIKAYGFEDAIENFRVDIAIKNR